MLSSLTHHFCFLKPSISVNLSSQIQPRWLASQSWGLAFLCSASAGVRNGPLSHLLYVLGIWAKVLNLVMYQVTSPRNSFYCVKIILSFFCFELKLFPYKSVNISLLTKFVYSQLFQKKKMSVCSVSVNVELLKGLPE